MTILESGHNQVTTSTTQAGWFDDPQGEHAKRYFNGTDWTTHVTHFGPSPCEGCGQLRTH